MGVSGQEKSFRLCRGSNLDFPVFQPVVRHYWVLPGSPDKQVAYQIRQQYTDW
jgi:hypothetical protein